ncbi:uncharacterized protein SOCE26_032660 [Sorangium cellulosum]|uniref:Uncharacterized protein n=1 Tax=Sorangium cellulosum TaxID=56 RepID=A0A2L0ERA7_SORCE|nr:uncharacterized protein SOCE26_032660 [Sorangium cellulosum]
MKQKRVIVTTLHEDEQYAAQQVLRVEEQGEGLVVGLIDEPEIENLRNAGLLVEELPDRDTLAREGFHIASNLEAYIGPLPPTPGAVEIAAMVGTSRTRHPRGGHHPGERQGLRRSVPGDRAGRAARLPVPARPSR